MAKRSFLKQRLFDLVILVCGVAGSFFVLSLMDGAELLPNLQANKLGKEIMVNTPYLKGYYRENSFFDRHSDSHALFYSHRPKNEVMKVSLRGELLHSFKVEKGSKEGLHLSEISQGHIYSIVQVRGIQKSTMGGEPVWYRPIAAHHDLEFDEEGNIYTYDLKITKRFVNGPLIEMFDDDFVKLSKEGKELDRITMFPLLTPYFTEEVVRKARDMWRRKMERHDIFHMNSIYLLDRDVPGLGKKGQLLLSARDLDLLLVLDLEKRAITWSYQSPEEIQHQHHVSVTSDNKVLIFDNGVYRGRSRLLKLDPITKEIVWKYESDKKSFYVKRHGSVEQMDDGSFIAALGRKGVLYEISPKGEVASFFKLSTAAIPEVNPYRLHVMKR